MKKSIIRLFITVVLFFCIAGFTSVKQQDNGLSVETYFKKINIKDTTVFVYFNADWCMPCVKLKPIMQELEKENMDVKFLSLDVDANPQIALHFEINTLPLFIIYKNGKQVWTKNIYMNKKDLQDKIRLYR